MISYAPLWATMAHKHATTYTLQVKGEISSSTIRRLKAGESVSTNTLNALCRVCSAIFPILWNTSTTTRGKPLETGSLMAPSRKGRRFSHFSAL